MTALRLSPAAAVITGAFHTIHAARPHARRVVERNLPARSADKAPAWQPLRSGERALGAVVALAGTVACIGGVIGLFASLA